MLSTVITFALVVAAPLLFGPGPEAPVVVALAVAVVVADDALPAVVALVAADGLALVVALPVLVGLLVVADGLALVVAAPLLFGPGPEAPVVVALVAAAEALDADGPRRAR